ncbi:MAG: adenylate/guanylate cyclase domain-containing protein [Firmicutes bacterium]|nr:adenylate/guanylate cyclase domain-containing protein [Bacillota bacterium]
MLLRLRRLTIPLIILVLFLIASVFHVGDRLENLLYDSWFKLSGTRDPGDGIVIIGIGEKSAQELGPEPAAWPRSTHAALLERLQGARVVGFDLVFDTPGDPTENARMAEAITRHGRVVLANYFAFEEEEGSTYASVKMPISQLTQGLAGIGFINTPKDQDNVVRRVTVVYPYRGRNIPGFSLATALVAQGLNPDTITRTPGGEIRVAGVDIPVDANNQALIDFWGPGGSFPTYEYSDVLLGRVDPEKFKDRICLVGATDVLLRDYENTPFTRGNMIRTGALPTPGVEIHANSIKTLFESRYFQALPDWIDYLFLAVVWVLTVLLTRRRSPWAGLVLACLLIAGECGLAYGLWKSRHLWLDSGLPMVLTLVTYTGVTAESYLVAEYDRRKTRALFSRYVSPAVVEQLTGQPELVALGGRRQDATVLFSDIRGFTSYSEAREPEEVVRRLNEYLTAMTATIFRHGGMIDKYMGDGIMAVFGVPMRQGDHAARAIRAAMEMKARLEELNQRWQELGEPLFKVGIGLSSGPVVAGNIGSIERMDYTVIGEDVNLASRLESLTKEYDTQLIISARTVDSLRDSGEEIPWSIEELGTTSVKGFRETISIYTIRA